MASITSHADTDESTSLPSQPSKLALLVRQFRSCKLQAKNENRYLRTPFIKVPVAGIAACLKLAGPIAEDDIFVDMGAGEGTPVMLASRKFNCKSIGIEIDSDLVISARSTIESAGLEHLVSIAECDFFSDRAKEILAECSVVMMFQPKQSFGGTLFNHVLSLTRPGTRIVSYAFHMNAAESAIATCETKGYRFTDGKKSTKSATCYLWRTPGHEDVKSADDDDS